MPTQEQPLVVAAAAAAEAPAEQEQSPSVAEDHSQQNGNGKSNGSSSKHENGNGSSESSSAKKESRSRRSRSSSRHRTSSRSRRSRHRSRSRSAARSSKRRSRRRSRSPSPRHRSHSRDGHRSSRRRSSRGRHNSRSRSPAQLAPAPRKPKDRSEVTIFVSQLHPKVDERDLFEFFSLVGQVEDIRLIRDPRTQKSKGLCYVELADVQGVHRAAALSGQLIRGYPIVVQVPNVAAKAGPPAVSGADLPLLITNVHPSVGQPELEAVFGAFGELLDLQMGPAVEAGGAQTATVQFKSIDDARTALDSLDGLELGDQRITVRPATQHGAAMLSPPPPPPLMSAAAYPAPPPQPQQSMDAQPPPLPSVDAGEPERLDDGEGGMIRSGSQRQRLFATLGGGALQASQQQQQQQQAKQPPQASTSPGIIAAVSSCVYFDRMLTPAQAQDPGFVAEVKEEVQAELQKFGRLLAIHIDPQLARVFVKFDSLASAKQCQAEIDGRFFAKQPVMARFFPEHEFNARFA